MPSSASLSPLAVARISAAAARDAPGVVALHGGTLGEIATYGQGGPVRGIRVRRPPGARVKVHVVARFGARLDEVADEVRARVGQALAEHAPEFADARVDVHIADVGLLTDDDADDARTAGS